MSGYDEGPACPAAGDGEPATAWAGYRDVDAAESVAANRRWWDAEADTYQAEHGAFLGGSSGADFVWCPEGLREADAGLLGDVRGRLVLEVGCGAAQCGRWLAGHGARVLGLDLSAGMLRHARSGDRSVTVSEPWLVQADAGRLPLGAGTVDVAFSAFGAVPFVADTGQVMREVARVLRPGGRWVFALTHPLRWIFPDDPGPRGLTVTRSYFDRTAYVEEDGAGVASYAEHHRTLGDRVREIVTAGLHLRDLIEPEWPPGHARSWGQWSPLRGALLPGTAIFVTAKPGPT